MKIEVLWYTVLTVIFSAESARRPSTQSGCILGTTEDFGTNSPLLITSGKFIYPERASPKNLSFAKNEIQMGYCPGAIAEVLGHSTRRMDVKLKCQAGSEFHAPDQVHEFSNVRCDHDPIAKTKTGEPCPSGNHVMIGFEIPKFVNLITVCFNSQLGRTTWAHAIIIGAINGRQRMGEPPEFRSAKYYQNMRVSHVYTKAAQREQLLKIFGSNSEALVDRYMPVDTERNRNSYFLARGHLIARADMYYTAQQYATYFYVNTLPMWQIVNAGNWLLVEERIRALAKKHGDIEVWAGSLGDLELADGSGKRHTIYLTSVENDSKTTKVIVVPKLLFKVAFHEASGSAVVYVTVNNPFLTGPDLPTDYKACMEHHPSCRTSDPRLSDYQSGYTYCCTWNEFITNPIVPKLGLPNLGNPAFFE